MNRLDAFLAAHPRLPSEASFADGRLLGEWRIAAFLGKGGSGEVYQVEHVGTGARAAAKILTRNDEVARRRFRREVEVLAKNECAALPRHFADGETDGRPYLIVELLDSHPLPAADAEVERYILAVCRGAAYLHARGLVHRDIKPSNVLHRANGEPVLIDFGLVKPISASASRPKDDLSIVDGRAVGVGTPRYAAPEQFNGDEITPASDIHALGMLLNECFGGKPPRSWRKIIAKATSSIPSNRYASVDGFVAAIRHRKFREHLAAGIFLLAILAGGAIATGLLTRRTSVSADKDDGAQAWQRPSGEVASTNVVRQESQSPRADLHGLGEAVSTNVVRQQNQTLQADLQSFGEVMSTNIVRRELVGVKWMDMNGQRVPVERRYRLVTNRVNVVSVELGGKTRTFATPVRLEGGREYWVTGPGMLDGTFYADGDKVTMRLKNCIVRNHAAEPLGKVGIDYELQDGAGLDLPELDEPDDHGRHYIERSGSPTRLTFKPADWKDVERVSW